MNMKEMRVGAIGIDKDTGESVVVLRDIENRRALPIWIGLPEAKAITFAVRSVVSPRPSTQDLLFSTIKQLGYEIKKVLIVDVKADTYIAEIVLQQSGAGEDGETVTLDSRPSDAIALAALADTPVFVAPHILDKAGIAANPERHKEETLEFRQFIDKVKASDFTLAQGVELPDDTED